MKAYAIALAIIVAGGFIFIGLVISGNFRQEAKEAPSVLNTESMREVDKRNADSTMRPAVIAIYLAGKSNASSNGTPWADVFVCATANRLDTLKTDTILLLDTRTGKNFGNLGDVAKYWIEIKSAKKLNQCRILIPENEVKKLKTYPYWYCNVQLVTDD